MRRRKLFFGAASSAGFPKSAAPSAFASGYGATRTEARKFMGMFFHRDFSPPGFECFILNSAFAPRPRQFIQDFLDDRFAGFFPGFGLALVKTDGLAP
jgi:hypothetical protein